MILKANFLRRLDVIGKGVHARRVNLVGDLAKGFREQQNNGSRRRVCVYLITLLDIKSAEDEAEEDKDEPIPMNAVIVNPVRVPLPPARFTFGSCEVPSPAMALRVLVLPGQRSFRPGEALRAKIEVKYYSTVLHMHSCQYSYDELCSSR